MLVTLIANLSLLHIESIVFPKHWQQLSAASTHLFRVSKYVMCQSSLKCQLQPFLPLLSFFPLLSSPSSLLSDLFTFFQMKFIQHAHQR